MMDQEALGGHIQYEVGIMLDDQQKEFWNSYTAKNREKFFWLFLNSFVENGNARLFQHGNFSSLQDSAVGKRWDLNWKNYPRSF